MSGTSDPSEPAGHSDQSHDHSHDHGVVAVPATKPRRQEQEPASTEITEVAPGILRSQLPISIPGLGHVNCYILEDERGFALVDPGLPGRESYQALKARLKQAGVPLKRVHSVIVTHSHPDHFGGATRLRADSGADIVSHRRFRVLWDPTEPPDVDLDSAAGPLLDPEGNPRKARLPWDPSPWGGDGMDLPWQRRARIRVVRAFPRLMRLPRPTVRLDDAQTIKLARREWVAVHTPGHTEDHLCLFDPAEGVMLSGDHVLPTITPHISGLIRAHDPLAEFFSSLDKIGAYGDRTNVVLPAHGNPFADLGGRADAIKRHHFERLDVLRHASGELGRSATVMEFSKHLFSARAQGTMADSETFAHLEHLRLAGEAETRRVDGKLEYSIG
jgi:glyoxylase-like metal-dependent hydrolase (beta-lactamase superfamily II)